MLVNSYINASYVFMYDFIYLCKINLENNEEKKLKRICVKQVIRCTDKIG